MKERATLIDRHLGRRVRARRVELGMSLQRLGGEVGVTGDQVEAYEGGHARMSAAILFKITETLQMPLPDLFEGLSAAVQPAQQKRS